MIQAEVGSDGEQLSSALEEVRVLVGASSSGPAHAAELGRSLERLAAAWLRHVAASECPNGLLTDVIQQSSRLYSAVEELREDHRVFAEELRAFRLRLVVEDGLSRPTREELANLLQMMTDHNQMAGSLIWDAYNFDIGGGN